MLILRTVRSTGRASAVSTS